jgi:hypothetical protein
MSWQEEKTDNTDTVVDEKWLRIPDAPIGKTSEVKLRILDEEPQSVWRHWEGNRPYNCPGINFCPVCKVRMEAKKNDPEGYKKDFRMDYRYYFNVFVDGKVKIFSFSSSVGRKLKMFLEKYGDLRDYDVSIIKRKTGPLPMNVEYDVIYEGPAHPLEGVEDLDRYDLTEYITPAKPEELKAVAAGETPPPPADSAGPTKATKADMILLKAAIEAKGFNLSEFGFVESSPPPKSVVVKLLEELKAE